MTTTVVSTRFATRRRTAAQWTSLNEVLYNGEIGFETDTYSFKIGDGVTAWNSIPDYFTVSGGGGGGTWGSITGTLSNQTDLQAALNGKETAGAAATAQANAIAAAAVDATSKANAAQAAAIAASDPVGTASGLLSTHIANAGDPHAAAGYIKDTSTGVKSISAGENSQASADVSTALGYESIAAGAYSTCMGAYSGASADNATAFGSYSTASHTNSVAMGYLSETGRIDEVSVGASGATRFVANVKNASLPQDAAPLSQVQSLITASAPTSIVGISGTLAQFNTALTDAEFATGGGTVTGASSGTNTGDQTNISGNAATVTTNANLTGHVTSTGNAAVLGSFTAAQLSAAVSDDNPAYVGAANTFTLQNTFAAGTITTSQPLTISQTWNAGGVTFEGLVVDITNTASAAASLALNLKVGGAGIFRVDRAGNVNWSGSPILTSAANIFFNSTVYLNGNATNNAKGSLSTHITLISTSLYKFHSGTNLASGSVDLGWGRSAAGMAEFNDGTTLGQFRDLKVRQHYVDQTITAGGTTGNQVINKAAGTVNIAAAGTTVTVTNSLCTTSSTVHCVIRTNDATARISNVVPGAGSFVINIVACTNEVSIGFLVVN